MLLPDWGARPWPSSGTCVRRALLSSSVVRCGVQVNARATLSSQHHTMCPLCPAGRRNWLSSCPTQPQPTESTRCSHWPEPAGMWRGLARETTRVLPALHILPSQCFDQQCPPGRLRKMTVSSTKPAGQHCADGQRQHSIVAEWE